MILDNADDLRLFGVGQRGKEDGTNDNLYKYVPHASQGIVLWTSRDARITGTLVGSPRGIAVRSMALDEAAALLAMARDQSSTSSEAGVSTLLEELQYLPLAVSQAGLYMRRMSMSAEQYLSLLRQGRTRWEVLRISDTDRHRRPEVSNSVLETWRISIERIRAESELSYRMLHVVAYVDNQDIPHELIMATADHFNKEDGNSTRQTTELEVFEDVARLEEFSFLSLRQSEHGERSYEMHKLVQEAVRYGLRIRHPPETNLGHAPEAQTGPEKDEAYYAGIALQVVDGLFPEPELTSWTRCEQYMTHAIRVGEWAEVAGTERKTSMLLQKVSNFLHQRGRWREEEPVDIRVCSLRRQIFGEKHPHTMVSMAVIGITYRRQGRYDEAESIQREVLQLQREVLGEKHEDTIDTLANLAGTCGDRGRYDEAESLLRQSLHLRQQILGKSHRETVNTMQNLAATYYRQRRYSMAQVIYEEGLKLRLEELGEQHPDTLRCMADLAKAYHALCRYEESEKLKEKALKLRLEVLGERHPDTLSSMASLGATYRMQDRYDEAEKMDVQTLTLELEELGEKNPVTLWAMVSLASTYELQGRYDEAQQLYQTALDLRRSVLGENHPDTIQTMEDLASCVEMSRQVSRVKSDKSSAGSLWKDMRRKAGHFRKSMFSRDQAS